MSLMGVIGFIVLVIGFMGVFVASIVLGFVYSFGYAEYITNKVTSKLGIDDYDKHFIQVAVAIGLLGTVATIIGGVLFIIFK